ncbi:MAG: biotin--[acetyl-CoA-carboxylase] ligase [Balneolaceae bacterium]|nr:MAG: biotin--[acetyl-CoA-carboxylase] ligase [Balneolaceae bacterium]
MDTGPFNEEEFLLFLQTEWVGKHFISLPVSDSTNSYLKELPQCDSPHGSVVFSDHQKKGRGQYGKRWVSEPCANLSFSVIFRPECANALPLLTLGCAYASLTVFERYSSESLVLKWPNDLLASGLKLGGLLTESVFMGMFPERVVVGIGLNLFQTTFPGDLSETAISLSQLSDKPFSREKILAELLQEIEFVYSFWKQQPSLLRGLVQKKMEGYGSWVRISVHNELQEEPYKFIGISERGELLMLNEQLDVHTFSYEQVRIITGSEGIPQTGDPVSSGF